jgi:hypothetical protein
MNKIFIVTLFSLLFAPLFAQSTSKNLPEFSELIVQGRISVILEEAKNYSADIKTSSPDIDLDKVTLINKGKQLIIRYAGVSIKELDVTITLHVPFLESIESKQGARISMASTMRIRSPKMHLSVFAGGVISAKIDVESADVKIDQGGDIFLVGTAKQLVCSVTTGGNLDAVNFVASNAVAKVRMGGTISIQTKETLNASVFSGGTIKYKGHGTVTETIKLGGTIQKM